MKKEPNQRRKVAKALSGIIQAEVDAICPYEGMTTYMDDIGVITGSKVDTDGNFVLFVDKENGRKFQLVMTPVKWEKRHEVQ